MTKPKPKPEPAEAGALDQAEDAPAKKVAFDAYHGQNPTLAAAKAKAASLLADREDQDFYPDRVDWRKVDFSGRDLRDEKKFDFKCADFTEATLKNANLSGGKNLQGAIFRGADVTNASFRGADIRWADFSGATGIESADFTDVIYWETVGL